MTVSARRIQSAEGLLRVVADGADYRRRSQSAVDIDWSGAQLHVGLHIQSMAWAGVKAQWRCPTRASRSASRSRPSAFGASWPDVQRSRSSTLTPSRDPAASAPKDLVSRSAIAFGL